MAAEYGKGMYLALRDQVAEAQTVDSGHLKSAGGQPSTHNLQTAMPAKDGAKQPVALALRLEEPLTRA